jgi:hypothetical protein
MDKIITRRKRFYDQKVTFESVAFKNGDTWFNTLYIRFAKEDFHNLNYPSLVECDWAGMKKRFAYNSCDVANLDWHCGITFYEETYDPQYEKTYIKAGCDFNHLYDEDYCREDCGELLLGHVIDNLLGQFVEIVELRNMSPEPDSIDTSLNQCENENMGHTNKGEDKP